MSEPKQKPHSIGSTVSEDPNDPTIYPKEGIEEQSCEHGVPNKEDCAMCIAEKEAAVEKAAEEKAKQDDLDGKL